jgi:hypothetical protein
MPLRLRLLMLAFAWSLGGCSFAFVHGPPANHRNMAFFDCSSSNALPVIDGLLTAAALGETLDATSINTTSKAELAIYAGEAALFAASAIYGFKKTSDCRDAQAAMLARTPLRPVGPTLAPPPPIDPWTGRPVPVAPFAAPPPDPER